MHPESVYATCFCVTPVSRSTGLIYKPEEKERCVATNARHAANGVEWPRGEQQGYWPMENYRWQQRGTMVRQHQHLVFHIQHPGCHSGGAFCKTAGHTVPAVQTAPPWTPHSSSVLPTSPLGFVLLLLLMESQSSITFQCPFSSSQCECRNSTFTFPISSGWDPGKCFFTSTFSIATEVLSPCSDNFQGPTAACRTQRRKRKQTEKYLEK